jgi:hypothetical protein
MQTQHLAAQAGPSGVRVNCIAPEISAGREHSEAKTGSQERRQQQDGGRERPEQRSEPARHSPSPRQPAAAGCDSTRHAQKASAPASRHTINDTTAGTG